MRAMTWARSLSLVLLLAGCGAPEDSRPDARIDARADITTSDRAMSDAASGFDAFTPPGPTDGGSSFDVGTAQDASLNDGARVSDASSVEASMPRPPPMHLCAQPRPAGAPMPPALRAYSGGMCPMLVPGMNRIMTGGASRAFILVVPTDAAPGERFPVSVLWHPLGSTAEVYTRMGVLQTAANTQRFIAILPESKGDLQLRWPSSGGGARLDEELRFFDDMLACVNARWTINTDCVATGGVSAGALWAVRLANLRASMLSSFISVSGGAGTPNPAWTTVEHRLPGMVVWGGPGDRCIVYSFDTNSRNLTTALNRDGHSVVECIHNCGHAMPPFDSADPFRPIVDFGLNHPFWLSRGMSPYSGGLPAFFPGWCAYGAGRARIRTGACAMPSMC